MLISSHIERFILWKLKIKAGKYTNAKINIFSKTFSVTS